MSETTPVLVVATEDGVATVTLNRPERRNALNRSLRRELRRAIGELEADDGIRAVILTGADPAFCAGLDLSEFGTADSGLADSGIVIDGPARGPLGAHRTPIIGAVNGVAVTGGFELALACDFLIASERARFADTHARVGVMPGWGLTVLLPEAVGVRRAREMSLTGNFIDAEVALAWGLVNRVVAHDDLLPACRQLATAIVSNDPAAVVQMLDTYERGTATTAAEAWEIEAEVHRRWSRDQAGAPEAAGRLGAVIDRGRHQLSES